MPGAAKRISPVDSALAVATMVQVRAVAVKAAQADVTFPPIPQL
jgi:hypothetical protein